MKIRILVFLLIAALAACDQNDSEIRLPEHERVRLALTEIGNVYSKSSEKGLSYTQVVSEVKAISTKNGLNIEPISKEDFYAHCNMNKSARTLQMPCDGPFFNETVVLSQSGILEEGFCFMQVWHYASGDTGYTTTCYTGGSFRTSAFQCYGSWGEWNN